MEGVMCIPRTEKTVETGVCVLKLNLPSLSIEEAGQLKHWEETTDFLN